MDNKKLSIGINIVLVLALGSSIAFGVYYRSQYMDLKKRKPKQIIKEVIKEVKVESPEKDAEIADLKKQLANASQQTPDAGKQSAPKTKPQDNDHRRGRSNFSLVELKANDPERYQRIMEHYKSMSERMTSGVADKMVFFDELDTSGMNEKELENHRQLLEKLAKMHEAAENISENPEEIRDNMRAQWENFRELRGLMDKEREYLLLDGAKKMGLDDKEASLLSDYIKNTYDITSGRSFFGRGRGGSSRNRR